MPILPNQKVRQRDVLRDVRPAGVRIAEYWRKVDVYSGTVLSLAILIALNDETVGYCDVLLIIVLLYSRWFNAKKFELPFKLPMNANLPDPHNPRPGKSGAGPSEGILFVGNLNDSEHPQHGQELWLTNSDARTHTLYLGTTGAGKTEGLKSLVTNALSWGSGFVYVDGKADTNLWADLYSLARRFGRDDDLLILNYMTANSDDGATSNTMNPFSNGSASYLTNMVTSLMPDAGGDNAMWKERAVALLGALMPALTWKRDKQGLLLDVSVMREYIELPAIIRLSRDPSFEGVPRISKGLQGYLNTLPGYVDAAFDDDGNEKPPSPDQPMYDLQVARQQHGYLSMQFTRSLQSLADEYGYIFKAQLADVDVLDVVLNRRILVALIPALEKSGDEAANLGKIIAASLKGMMGATLGNTVEGSWESAIGSKQTHSASSFMTVFDEVGYYTAQGMAVMAAQARSLGFSLIFAAQDLPSMEKRVKQEAQSILGNCNLKIFGKLEDPTDTKDFFQKHVGTNWVLETRGMTAPTNTVASLFISSPFYDDRGAGGVQTRVRADYDHLRTQREGEVHMLYADWIVAARMFHAVPGKVKSLRVHKLLPVESSTVTTTNREKTIQELASRLKTKDWTAASAGKDVADSPELKEIARLFASAEKAGLNAMESGAAVIAGIAKFLEKGVAQNNGEQHSAPKQHAQSSSDNAAAMDHDEDTDDDLAAMPSKAESKYSAVDAIKLDEIFDFSKKPLLQDEDVFAISELEPVVDEKPANHGFVNADLDLGMVPKPDVADHFDINILNENLPENLVSSLAKSAKKLNKGLADDGKGDSAE